MNKEVPLASAANPLFENLLDDLPADADVERETFAQALADMAMTSVFDIVRQSKTDFKKNSSMMSAGVDSGVAYDSAMSYAVQIGRAYREQMLAGDAEPTTSMASAEPRPSHAELFPHRTDQFCAVGALEAMDSPVAYLSSLYRLATSDIEHQGDGTAAKITLDERRPDIRELIIDQQSVHAAVPMLDIVNDTLMRGIRQDRQVQGLDDTPIFDLLSQRRHPFMFPYNFPHHQVMLGLEGSQQPKVGELNYQISFQLPDRPEGKSRYGAVAPPLDETASDAPRTGVFDAGPTNAQCLMSGLSPQQQQLLIEPTLFKNEDVAVAPVLDEQQAAFFLDHFGIAVKHAAALTELTRLDVFSAQTAVAPKDVQALLAQGIHALRISPNFVLPHAENGPDNGDQWGAGYVNGANTAALTQTGISPSSAALRLVEVTHDAGTEWVLINTSPGRFDRLQRMIRLQRWTGFSYAELDSLALAVISAEGGKPSDGALTVNFLRSLGVYRYLNRRYALALEEFAALLHWISPCSSNERASMLDRVFNASRGFDSPLVLDSSDLNIGSAMEVSRATAQLCAGLRVQPGSGAFDVLLAQTSRVLGGRLKYDLPTVSSLYRQARVAQLFGLSIEQSAAALAMLGGEDYLATVARGALRAPDSPATADAPADMLDILMHMDWLTGWLAATGQTVDDLHSMLTSEEVDPGFELAASRSVERYHAAMVGLCDQAVDLSSIPLPLTSISGMTLDWPGAVLAPLASRAGVILDPPASSGSSFEVWAAERITEALSAITFSENAAEDSALKQVLMLRLTQHVASAKAAQRDCIHALLRELSALSPERIDIAMRWSGTGFAPLIEALCEPNGTGATVNIIHTVIRHGNVFERLGLNTAALDVFLSHPHWLDARAAMEPSPLPLRLSSLYLFTQYQRWIKTDNNAEQDVLAYFDVANQPVAEGVAHAKTCSTSLAALIRWDVASVAQAVALLPGGTARSMDQVDWVRRVRGVCQASGLNIKSVLMTARLDAAGRSGNRDWQAAGEAIVSSGG